MSPATAEAPATTEAPVPALARPLLAVRDGVHQVPTPIRLGVAVVLALVVGYQVTGVAFDIVVAAGIGGVLLLGYLALHRFEWFIWVVLLVRPLLDLTKGERGAGGSGHMATMLGAAVLVAGIVWLAALSRERHRLPMGAVSRALLLLTLSSLISVLHSAQPLVSAAQMARTTAAVVLFIVLEQLLRTRRLAMWTLVVCALSTIGPIGVALFQLATGDGSKAQGVSRITGSFLHPNTFGFVLVIVLLMGYALRRHVSRRARWTIDALLVVSAVELLFTYSRGSWFVLVLGLLVLAVLAERRLFLVLPILGAGIYFFLTPVVSRVADLAREDTVGGRPGNSASWRLAHLEGLLAASDGLTLFGIGPKMADQLTEGSRAPHNDAVRLFVENGAFGLVCYLLFLAALVLVACRALRRLRTGFERGLAVGFAATVAAFLADSMGANLITQFVSLIYVLGLTAVVQAYVATADTACPGNPNVSDPACAAGDDRSECPSTYVQSSAGQAKE
jgi:O-antigen ligase